MNRIYLTLFTGFLNAILFTVPQLAAKTMFTVTNTADNGAGSLRQAILDANAVAGTDTIKFNIPGTGPHTISTASALPEIDDTLVIGGYTQAGAAPATANAPATLMIELNGVNAGDDSHGLALNADNSVVRGLVINRFGRSGIVINGNGCTIQGNYIGTDPSGAQAVGNGFRSTDGFVYDAIWINDASDNQIGGANPALRNLLSASAGSGVYIGGANATGNRIAGNFIGTDAAGTQALGNELDGVTIDIGSANNQIGGTAADAGNLISGNLGSGVLFTLSAGANRVQGNLIGTDVSGTLALGNAGAGVGVFNGSGNLIGGTVSGARNVISGNTQAGVGFIDSGQGNVVQGNFIGTDVSGTQALGNGDVGVLLVGSKKNLIGGISEEARNVISGNAKSGVLIEAQADSNNVQGNIIGLDVSGTKALGNDAHGVAIVESSNNLVGGVGVGARNVISANTFAGVRIVRDQGDAPASGNRVQGNYIGTDTGGTQAFGNGEDGVSIRDASDNLVGGASEAARNVLAGQGFAGIFLRGEEATNNKIQGNYIGTDASGANLLPNNDSGVDIFLASDNLIGGSGDGEGNLIAGNKKSGVTVRLGSSSSASLQERPPQNAETLGYLNLARKQMPVSGRRSRGRTASLQFIEASPAVFISAASASHDRQETFWHTQTEEQLPVVTRSARRADPGIANAIHRNSMFGNAVLGIDLASVSRTNDAGDADSGENRGQNFPEIQTADGSGSTLSVTYLISSSPNNSAYPITVEFFLASQNNQGKTYLGTDTYSSSDAGNNKTASILPGISINTGDKIVATATDADGNTSEFSDTFAVSGVVSVEDPEPGSPVTYALQQNYPNPFNPSTTISYSVESAGEVELRIYNMLGQVIRTLVQGNKPAGDYFAVWDGKDDFGRHVTSGLYVYKLVTSDFQSTRKMVFLK